ncbi:MAG: saccharopine dehydrogenase NADP-binding domain-containing protein, partial [Solirubrobacteraceae bacterium]
MASRIVVFGATGYTGRLVAERLVAQGARPVLAGRSESRLAELAERLGGLETARADAMRRNSVFSLVRPGDVLVSTVGPFAKWGEAAVRASIAAGATYLDSTGEPVFIRRVFEELGAPAARNGAT